ncbi:CD99 molecule isoform X1 [Denticeps clupeoides]|uniref:CD99 antigen-like protein 2 n=1 Tax=Denticeps clupeoides TaxID=299321 RepID=A0AAY4BPH3_9TELE|nr:CD99 antigen-like isoform X1 [Denticeps clupeoides]
MRSYFWLVFLACVVSTRAQGFDLGDALEDLDDPKPKATTKAPEVPKKSGTGDFDILDALGDDGKAPPKKPSGGGLDLEDALLPGPEPKKPVIPPKVDGGKGGNFDDSDLDDVVNGDSGYKPEGGKGKAGGTAYDHAGGSSEGTSQGSGPIAGIVSAVGVALIGAASSYFAYQKKRLCFKFQGGADPESGKGQPGTRSDQQVLSNLLRNA